MARAGGNRNQRRDPWAQTYLLVTILLICALDRTLNTHVPSIGVVMRRRPRAHCADKELMVRILVVILVWVLVFEERWAPLIPAHQPDSPQTRG